MKGRGDIRALAMASDLRAFLLARPFLDLEVHSVFERAANLLTEEGPVISLMARDRDLMPMGLILDLDDLGDLGLEKGDRLSLDRCLRLTLPREGGRLILKEARVLQVSLQAWKKGPVPPELLDRIRDRLVQSGSEGLAPLAAFLPEGSDLPDQGANIYCRFIGRDLKDFLDSLEREDLEGSLKGALGLTGFGPGLTPSGDDFLAGVLLEGYYRGDPPAFGPDLVREARDRTTLVAWQMLVHALEGRANTLYLDLIRTALAGDLEEVDGLLDRLMAYGATSGADFLFGFYAAARIGAKKIKKTGLLSGSRQAKADFAS